MVRLISSYKINKLVYKGTLSGKIFHIIIHKKIITNKIYINYNQNKDNDTITCLKYLHLNLYSSDTDGNIFIFKTKEVKIIIIIYFINLKKLI